MATLDTLQSILASAIAAAPLDKAFGPAMEAALVKGHTAAVLAAAAERAGVRPDSGLFKGLSKAERADIRQAVQAQLQYLKGFLAARGDMSEAAIRARAAMYAGSIRATFYGARYPGLPFYPGQGTECLTNCKCSWEQQGDEYHWTLHAAEHCSTCESRASGNPYHAE